MPRSEEKRWEEGWDEEKNGLCISDRVNIPTSRQF